MLFHKNAEYTNIYSVSVLKLRRFHCFYKLQKSQEMEDDDPHRLQEFGESMTSSFIN